uniref:UbiA family prenyltransferase n=1 Tax=Glycomyces tenuis TaxID=58116 RepID=UPI00047B7AAD
GVRSTPAKWGVKAALGASSATHAVTWAMFAWFGALTGFGVPYWIGLALVAAVLVYEHAIVKADDLSKANRAFFTANGVVAIALFAFALGNLLLR